MDSQIGQHDNEAATAFQGPSYSLWHLMRYVLRLGTFGFGGPVALVGYMYRDLVENRKWISQEDYKDGLTLAQLAPGPLAAQLAIYLGFVHYRVLGATLVGIAFVLPSFLMVVLLGWAYQLYGGLNWMQAVFYGVGAAVIGIIAHSALKLTQKTIGRDWLLWVIYIAAAAFTVITQSERVLVFLAAGVIVWIVKSPPRIFLDHKKSLCLMLPVASVASVFSTTDWPELGKIFLFFTKAGAFIFGSGLAIVPFLYGGVVKEYHWLNDRQFVDAVAVAIITPGPVVITVGFIGYLIAGVPGAIVAAVGTFLPCYLFTIIPAPYFRKYGKQPGLAAFVDGVTSAAIGTITGAVFVLGERSIIDKTTAILAVIAFVLLWKIKKLPEPVIVLVAALIGLLIYPLSRH